MDRRRLRRTLDDARRPGLLVLCGLVGLLEVASWLVVAPFLPGAPRPALLAWVALQRLLLVVALSVLLPGCYATVREDLGPRGALAATRNRLGPATRSLLAAMVASRLVVAALTAVALLVALAVLGVLDTASVWTSALFGAGLDRDLLATVGVPAGALGASWLARGATGLNYLRAIEADEPPARAALWSVRAWRGRPRGLLAYAVLRGCLLTGPTAAALAVLATWPTDGALAPLATAPAALALAAVVLVATTALARAVLVAVQTGAYDRHGARTARTLEGGTSSPLQRRGVLLAAVLVLAAVVGLGVVRTVDVQPGIDDDGTVQPTNATATVRTAVERTRASDLLTEQTTAVRSEGAWTVRTRRQALLERSDRSIRYYGTLAGVPDRTIYATDGRLAMLADPTPPGRPGPLHLWIRRGEWTVLVGHSYGWGIEDRFVLPPVRADWRLRERSQDRLVYRVWDPQSLAGHGLAGVPAVPPDAAPGGQTGARIVIDRETLTVREASVTVVPAGAAPPTRWERTVPKVGDVTAKRPGSVGPPSLPARLWDVVYY